MDGDRRSDEAPRPSPDEPPARRVPEDAPEGGVPRDDGGPAGSAAPPTGPADEQMDEQAVGAPGEPETSTSTGGSGPPRSWSRLVAAVATAALTVTLGFALTTQIRSTAEPEDQVVSREEDLVLILDELNAREEELRRQIGQTRQTVDELSSGQQQSGSALQEARSRAEAIGILAGTLPARGPGLLVTIQDPEEAVPTSVILGAIQELRGAGAEAMQIDDVRVVVSSAVTGSPGQLRIDGQPLTPPYDIRVVGPPAAMEVALNVSGGVVADIGRVGGKARVEQRESVVVDAVVE